MTAPCDVGRNKEELIQMFPEFNEALGGLPDKWWLRDVDLLPSCDAPAPEVLETNSTSEIEAEASVARRVAQVTAWLRTRPEHVIALVGHADWFHRFTGHFVQGELFGRWLDNCGFEEVLVSKLEGDKAESIL
mmetsp:Transcript_63273/g.149947  ORF Transcript_63273/g.149947 Transcript_63273/m.149947 type:complete len:133 (-) Transcript_63273:124-522(-)